MAVALPGSETEDPGRSLGSSTDCRKGKGHAKLGPNPLRTPSLRGVAPVLGGPWHMLTWRSGGAIVIAALVAGGSLCWKAWNGTCADAAPSPSGTPPLTGFLEAPGIDPARFQARCTSMRLEEHPVVHLADIDVHGRFEFTGLADVDHCIEIVL